MANFPNHPLLRCAQVECAAQIPPDVDRCPVCGRDVGFPNVRLSEQVDEQAALQQRINDADTSAVARGCQVELDSFAKVAGCSQCVVTIWLSTLAHMIAADRGLASFYKQVASGMRLVKDSALERAREPCDAAVSPHYHRELNFGALSVDGQGIPWYGNIYITLKDVSIKDRTSVFEENPMDFLKKHPFSVETPVPPGYRAPWYQRGELARAKLHPKIAAGMSPIDFATVLLPRSATSPSTDFIEAHIFGNIHPNAIERISIEKFSDPDDQLDWSRVKRRLEAQSIQVTELWS